MNFDKFKSIDMPDINVNADADYLNKINSLPGSHPKRRIFAAIGTVAAAAAIVTVVALWALIGRGLRSDNIVSADSSITRGEDITVIPDTEIVYEIDKKMQNSFVSFYNSHNISLIPFFELGTVPSPNSLVEYIKVSYPVIAKDGVSELDAAEWLDNDFGYEELKQTATQDECVYKKAPCIANLGNGYKDAEPQLVYFMSNNGVSGLDDVIYTAEFKLNGKTFTLQYQGYERWQCNAFLSLTNKAADRYEEIGYNAKIPDTDVQMQDIEINDQIKKHFNDFCKKYSLDRMPLFDNTQKPSLYEMIIFAGSSDSEFYSKFSDMSKNKVYQNAFGRMLNEFSRRLFNVEYDIKDSFMPHHIVFAEDVINTELQIVSLKSGALSDGTKVFELTYTVNGTAHMLRYIANEFYNDPLLYLSCVPLDTPLKKDYADEKIFYAIYNELLSHPEIEDVSFGIRKIKKESDTLYSCGVYMQSICYISGIDNENAPTKLLGQLILKPASTINKLYIDCIDGEFTVALLQNRDISLDTMGTEGSRFPLEGYIPSSFDSIVFKACAATSIPLFESADTLTREQILGYAELLGKELNSARDKNKFAYEYFGIDAGFTDDMQITPQKLPQPTDYTLKEVIQYTTASEHNIYKVVYTANGEQYTLKYVRAITGIDVGYFISHTKG